MAAPGDDRPNTRPMPNPWATPRSSGYDTRPGEGEEGQLMVKLGNTFYKMEDVTPQLLCMNQCCPCLIGDPLSDERKATYIRYARTFTFIVSIIQILYFIVIVGVGGVVPLRENPMIGPGVDTLIDLGAKDTSLIQEGEVYRLAVPSLMHAGFIHLGMNMFAQLRVGTEWEIQWGSLTYGIIYAAAGVGGTLMSCVFSPNSVGVGASGAILGLFGAMISLTALTWHRITEINRRLMLAQIIPTMVILFVIGFIPFVDGAAHFGGLVVGGLCGFIAFLPQRYGEEDAIGEDLLPETKRTVLMLRIGACVALGLYFLLFVVLLYRVVKSDL